MSLAGNDGASVCEYCGPGFSANKHAHQCEECEINFSSIGGSNACTPCSVGKYTFTKASWVGKAQKNPYWSFTCRTMLLF